jgi:outer membrane lipoprotein-sorting protein
MIRRSGALALAAVFVFSVAGRSAPQATVDELIAKNLAAKGGLDRLKAILTIKQTSVMTMQGADAPMTVYSKRPNLLRQEIKVSGQTVINAFDGVTPWIINPLIGPPLPIVVTGPQADMIREQSSFDGPLVDYKLQGYTIAVDGLESSGERALLHLRLTSRTNQVSNLYLDSLTFLDAKLTTEMDKVKLEQEFLDYRDVEGIKVPFLMRTSMNGVVQSEIKVQKVEFNKSMDDALFSPPKGL